MAHTPTERLREKTVERQFLYELERDFELAPAMSRAVLATARQVLFPSSVNGDVREGQMRVTAVDVSEASGKPLSAMKKVCVVVTVDGTLIPARGSSMPTLMHMLACNKKLFRFFGQQVPV